MEDKPLAPGLYLVATPIGNLEDITLRALRVLRQADRIACEDTRQTQKLLHHFAGEIGPARPTVSYHLHNEAGRGEELLAELEQGARIALVSDAGTPGIADPGAPLVAAAIARGIPVFPVPGANAALAALVASGLLAETFTFHGFLPAKPGQRRSALEALPRDGATHIFYESPHRALEALADLEAVFSPAQPLVLARELTKLHEEFLRGTIAQVRAILAARADLAGHLRGEMVLLLPLMPDHSAVSDSTSIADAVRALMASAELSGAGLSEKDALKQVARERGIGKSDVYREWQREGQREQTRRRR